MPVKSKGNLNKSIEIPKIEKFKSIDKPKIEQITKTLVNKDND